MTDVAPSGKSINQTTTDPVIPKKAAKAIEAAEPTNRRPTLSDVLISDAEDSHPTVVSPLRRQSAKPALSPNEYELLQMLSSMQKQWRINAQR